MDPPAPVADFARFVTLHETVSRLIDLRQGRHPNRLRWPEREKADGSDLSCSFFKDVTNSTGHSADVLPTIVEVRAVSKGRARRWAERGEGIGGSLRTIFPTPV